MELSRLRNSIVLLAAIIMFGTLGYRLTENMTFFEAFYMTVITISTVGFSEIRPLSDAGRIITIFIIGTGISLGAYTIGLILNMIIEGELRRIFGRRKLEKDIDKLKNHYIVCGYGRIGTTISRELHIEKIPFVVIEMDAAKAEELEKKGYLYLNMDATSEDALVRAGIDNAKGIVTAVQSDANNVFITLTAKSLRPDIFVLSRSSDEKNEGKLRKAGATRVVSPYLIGGRRMAHVLKSPTVVDFIDSTTMNSKFGLNMAEATVGSKSNLLGKTLVESNIRKDFGVIIIAIKKPTGEMVFNPMPTEVLEVDDVLVAIGQQKELKRLNERL